MKKALGLLMAFLLIAANLFAADGDLIVNGKVGIGTSTPGEDLSILRSSGYAQLKVKTTDSTSGASLEVESGTNSGLITVGRPDIFGNAANLGFRVGGSNALVITPSGNIGIGMTGPTEKLEVNGNTKISGTIRGATYGFGGMFNRNADSGPCNVSNPFTGSCSCPSGFTQLCVFGACGNEGDRLYYCYK